MSSNSKVPALEKGLKILEYLAQSSEFRTLTQIANANGYSLSEIQRTINFFVESGYFIKNQSGAYYLSSKLYRIANQNPPQKNLLSLSVVPMEEFVIQTGESMHLCVLIETQANFIGQIEGTKISRLTMRLGSYPAHRTTSGKLLIALTNPNLLNYIDENQSTKERLKKELSSIQKQGYVSCKSQYTAGVQDISVPVSVPGVGVVAAVATSFLYSLMETESKDKKKRTDLLINKLLETADKISRRFEITSYSK